MNDFEKMYQEVYCNKTQISKYKKELTKIFGKVPTIVTVELPDVTLKFKVTQKKNKWPEGLIDYYHLIQNLSFWRSQKYIIKYA